ncbi:hypothetical protein B2G71_06265 [Novosphingobium sp. PC22D]|nr:hypothetical protein B2G71_06265 [Novosphingobium sp. PC22D]
MLGAWGSGSSAVAGYLDRCGAHSCPPHFRTNDARTSNSHEPEALRAILLDCFDEEALSPKYGKANFAADFATWIAREKDRAAAQGRSHIVIKHPLLCLLVAELETAVAPRFLLVTRSLARIEATRARRQWPSVFGAQGARLLYPRAAAGLLETEAGYLALRFERFLCDEALRGAVLAYLGMTPNAEQAAAAREWLE